MPTNKKDHPNLGASMDSMHPLDIDDNRDDLDITPEEYYQTVDHEELVDECSVCLGSGKVEDLSEEMECPYCDGTGDVISDASMDDEFGPSDYINDDEI